MKATQSEKIIIFEQTKENPKKFKYNKPLENNLYSGIQKYISKLNKLKIDKVFDNKLKNKTDFSVSMFKP